MQRRCRAIKQAINAAQMLTVHMVVKDGVIHAFHAMGGMSTDKDKVTMFKLTHSLEQGSAAPVVGLSSAQADRSKTATGKKPSAPSQGPPADATGRGSLIAKNGRGEPRSAQRKSQAAAEPEQAPQQSIFSKRSVKHLESLPVGIRQNDLQRIDRKRGKPSSGPSNAGELSQHKEGKAKATCQDTIHRWLQHAGTSVGSAERETKGRSGAPASDRATPLLPSPSLALANPDNLCYLNSLVQALMWMYYVGASARNSDFGDLRPLLRPLLSSTGTVQLRCRKAWLDVMRAWTNMRQQHNVAELLPYFTRKLNVPGTVGS